MKQESNSESITPTGFHAGRIKHFVNKLPPIAEKARKEPKIKFTSLLHHLTPELIEEHVKKISNKSAVGIDGLKPELVKKHIDWLLPRELDNIFKGCYKAPMVRRVYIPKENGKERPIGIGTVLDRAIQASMATVLSQIYEQDFLSCSFGYREKRSAHQALCTLTYGINGNRNFVLEVDIRNFFGSLNREWLRKFLEHRIGDRRVLKLIDSWLNAGVLDKDEVIYEREGTVQGGSISPLLANIYLHYVLDLWFEKKIKPRMRGRCMLVRWADDFAIACEFEDDAKDIANLVRVRFKQFGLEVAEEKTRITNLDLRKRTQKEDRRHICKFAFKVSH